MLSKYENKISEETLQFPNEKHTFKLYKILVRKFFVTSFDLFKNWNLLRSLKINSHKLKSDKSYLLDQ